MAQTRSITDQAIDRELPPYGRSDFFIANVLTDAGLKQLDIYAALLARVTSWEFTMDGGYVNNNAPGFFTSNTTLSGTFSIGIDYVTPPPIATEKVFSFQLELYAIRDDRSGTVTSGASTALDITFPGDEYSGTLPELSTVYDGPKVDTLTTQVVSPTVQTAVCQFDFELIVTCNLVDGADTYNVFFKLTTNPVGHDNGSGGTTSPVAVGFLTIEIPDWLAGTGFVTIQIPLYADSIGPDDTIWATSSSNTYGSGTITGDINITMRPVVCWHYQNSLGVDTWNDDGALAISIAQLYNGEP